MLTPSLPSTATKALKDIKKIVAAHGIVTEWQFEIDDPSGIIYWVYEENGKRLRLNIEYPNPDEDYVEFTLMVEPAAPGTVLENPEIENFIASIFQSFDSGDRRYVTADCHKNAQQPAFRPFREIGRRRHPMDSSGNFQAFEIEPLRCESWIKKLLNGFSAYKPA
jgi:hypothetical protein